MTATEVTWRDFKPGDAVAWVNDDGEVVRGRVHCTPAQEPWLGRCLDSIQLHRGDEPDEGLFDSRGPEDLTHVRCTCCDGPDGRGYTHVRRLSGLREALDAGAEGPFAVEDHRRRVVLSIATATEARYVLDDWDHEQALVARESRVRR